MAGTGATGFARTCIVVGLLTAGGYGASATTAQESELDLLVTRVGQRVAEFYKRAQTVVCTERSTVQPVGRDWWPDGMPRTTDSDLRVELRGLSDEGGTPDPAIVRDILRVNGRMPRPGEATSRAGCTDPNPLSPEPLAFMLPSHREEYRFTSVKRSSDHDRPVLVIAFHTVNRESRPELIEDERGHEDCFDWKGPIARSGRVWVDADTADVLKVESNLDGPVDIRVPDSLQRRYRLSQWIVLERDTLTMHYRTVRFTDPDELLLLPDTIESLTLLRSDLQSIRRTDTFRDYRRFLTAGHLKKFQAHQ
ncbi:MAG TPA: hypothetical protein VL484_15890 [Vicinamibacterales bacterium]|jgi:hypothetical protein|nr:hypothetical protein [Vicinamibacterales bacterium]